MKLWAAKILLSVLTFAVGTVAAFIYEQWRARAIEKPVSVWGATEIDAPEVASATPAEISKPLATRLSPYEIKRLVDDNRINGSKENILTLAPVLEQLRVEQKPAWDFLAACKGSCEAAIFTLELDGLPRKETILRLTDSGGNYLHLIFTKLEVGGWWVFFGHIYRYSWWMESEPPPQTVTLGGKHYLKFTDQTGHGSAYGESEEAWYEVDDEGIRRVLAFKSGLFVGYSNPGIESHIKIVGTRFQDGTATIILEVSNTYTGCLRGYDCFPLFSTKRRVTFVRKAGGQKFDFDPLKSEMSLREFASLEDNTYQDRFLRYNFQSLRSIAAAKDKPPKEWLSAYLDACDASADRESLLKILTQNPQ